MIRFSFKKSTFHPSYYGEAVTWPFNMILISSCLQDMAFPLAVGLSEERLRDSVFFLKQPLMSGPYF
jgi:hypothetical protein